MRGRGGAVALASMVVFAFAACGGGEKVNSQPISSETVEGGMGQEWPLTVDHGELACTGAGAVTFKTGATTYAVNGTARGQKKWPDIDPIWADRNDGTDLKVNIGPLIDLGLAMCD